MQFSAIFVSALAAATSIEAATLRHAKRNTCEILTPDVSTLGIAVLADGGRINQEVAFHPGLVSRGPCTLFARFPAGTPVGQTHDLRADIRAVNTDGTPGSLIGSFGPLELEDNAVVEDTLVVINSVVCQEELRFEFSVADESAIEGEDVALQFDLLEASGLFLQVGDHKPVGEC